MELDKKNVPASWVTNKRAGVEWFRGFMKRHPRLSVVLSKATSLERKRKQVEVEKELLIAARKVATAAGNAS